jgi:hypothetical protein
MFKALQGELPNYIANNIISYINIEPETSGDLSCLLHFEVGNAK